VLNDGAFVAGGEGAHEGGILHGAGVWNKGLVSCLSCLEHDKSPLVAGGYKWALGFNPGNDLVSHAVAHAVPSAQRGLTSVFGMGTGVTLSVRSPETCETTANKWRPLTIQY
jgi:hypothetical protein